MDAASLKAACRCGNLPGVNPLGDAGQQGFRTGGAHQKRGPRRMLFQPALLIPDSSLLSILSKTQWHGMKNLKKEKKKEKKGKKGKSFSFLH